MHERADFSFTSELHSSASSCDLQSGINIDKDEIGIDKNMNGVFPVSSEKTFKNMSKSRTTLFQGREDDEPLAQQNNSFGNFSDAQHCSHVL